MAKRRSLLQALLAMAGMGQPATTAAAHPMAAATAPARRGALPLGRVAIAGTRYHDLPRVVAGLRGGQTLHLIREPGNAHDRRAIAILTEAGEKLGYVPRRDNRHLAAMLDGGARFTAELTAPCADPQDWENWQPQLHLALADVVPPAPRPLAGPAAAEQLTQLLRAPPLLAEGRSYIPGSARALMLAGPAAGWVREQGQGWLPPGSLPWPDEERLSREYELLGGELALAESRRAMEAAAELGLPPPGEGTPMPEEAPLLAAPPERPRLLLRGVLRAPGFLPEQAMRPQGPLGALSLQPDLRAGAVMVRCRLNQPVAALPRQVARIVCNLIEEGHRLDIVPQPPGPFLADGVRVPFALRLRGDEPVDQARRRVGLLLRLAPLLPPGFDAARDFGTWPTASLARATGWAESLVGKPPRRLERAEAEVIILACAPQPPG